MVKKHYQSFLIIRQNYFMSFRTLIGSHNFAENSISYGYRHKITHPNNHRVPGTANQRRSFARKPRLHLAAHSRFALDCRNFRNCHRDSEVARRIQGGGQAITALSQGQSDRNHIYANKSTVNLATGAVTSTSGIFIQQATTERAGAMRAQQVIDLNATKKAVAEVEKILEIVQVKLGMTEGSKTLFNTAQIAVIDSIVRNIDFSFDTLKINIERPVQYAEASEIIRLTATKGRVIDRRRVYRDSVEAFNQLDTVAYKKSAAEASTEHTATTRLYNPPDGTAVAVVALIIAGVLIYLFLRKK